MRAGTVINDGPNISPVGGSKTEEGGEYMYMYVH